MLLPSNISVKHHRTGNIPFAAFGLCGRRKEIWAGKTAKSWGGGWIRAALLCLNARPFFKCHAKDFISNIELPFANTKLVLCSPSRSRPQYKTLLPSSLVNSLLSRLHLIWAKHSLIPTAVHLWSLYCRLDPILQPLCSSLLMIRLVRNSFTIVVLDFLLIPPRPWNISICAAVFLKHFRISLGKSGSFNDFPELVHIHIKVEIKKTWRGL